MITHSHLALQIGEDLVNVLDNLRVKMVIGLGDGAGANIFARFAAMHAPRCLGIVLINPTPTVATFMEKFKVRKKGLFVGHVMFVPPSATPSPFLR